VLELACGTGQVGRRLAAAGWRVTGLDWSAEMLAFLSESAASAGVDVATLRADMTDFTGGLTAAPFDAAFCPMNSLAVLPNEQALVAHLRSTAAALKPRAPYVIDLSTVEESETNEIGDEWGFERDGVEVRAAIDGGTPKVFVVDPALDEPLELGWGPDLPHTPGGITALIEQSGVFNVVAVHPEDGHDPDGVSTFAETPLSEIPLGRSFVVLRRL
jgi:SAM-dependent methyltransferase